MVLDSLLKGAALWPERLARSFNDPDHLALSAFHKPGWNITIKGAVQPKIKFPLTHYAIHPSKLI